MNFDKTWQVCRYCLPRWNWSTFALWNSCNTHEVRTRAKSLTIWGEWSTDSIDDLFVAALVVHLYIARHELETSIERRLVDIVFTPLVEHGEKLTKMLKFLAGRAYATVLRLSSVRNVLWLNGAS